MRAIYLISCTMLASLLSAVSPAQDEPAAVRDRQNCPPDCGIHITVPSETDRSPTATPVTQLVKPNETLAFESNRPVQVIFPEQTPFADRQGRPVYIFNLRSRRANQLVVRDDEVVCTAPPGCKYIVIDRSEPGRPPLDPWIIIDR